MGWDHYILSQKPDNINEQFYSIQDCVKNDGLQVAYNFLTLKNGLAVRFSAKQRQILCIHILKK